MKHLPTLTSIFLISTGLMAGTYSGGSGTDVAPYQISNTADLIELSQTPGDWDKYFYQMNAITFPEDETTFDWDNDGTADWDTGDQAGFSPIGNSSTPFTGNYDGGEKSINYLYIDRNQSYLGLFGVCGDAVVENLELLNVYVRSTAYLHGTVGGLIGLTGTGGDTRTVVSRCYVTVSSEVLGNSSVGGLVGNNYGNSTITDCFSSATVTAGGYHGCDAGGLVGNNQAEIKDCYANGDVTGSSSSISHGRSEIGGLVGDNSGGTIQDSYASGEVSGNESIGGLVGYTNYGEISGSFAVGDVAGTYGVGGLVGYTNNATIIENCYSRGNVTRSSGTYTNIGAFLGHDDDGITMRYCYSTSNVFSSEGNAWGSGDGYSADQGFIGSEDVSGTYTGNFFDSQVSNQSTDAGGAATARTTAEMTTGALTFTYADNLYLSSGWDFKGEGINGTDEVWNIGNSRNDGYPYFDYRYDSDSGIDIDAPTQSASDIAFSGISRSEMILSWSNGNGRRRAVFAKQAASGNASPVENTTYAPSDTFGNGGQIGSSGWYSVYEGTGSVVKVQGLAANTDYIFHVIEYEDTTGYESYRTATATHNPRTQATNNSAPPNYALSFDGEDDYVDITYDLSSMSTLTIEAWFKTTGTDQTCILGFQEDQPGDAVSANWIPILVAKSDGTIRGEFWTGSIGAIETSSGGYNDGEFHHVALVGGSTTQTLYVDGELVGSRSGTIDYTLSDYISLGTGYGRSYRGFPYSGWHYFDGILDEVRIWSTARSQFEIQGNMHRELDGDEANLLSYYQMRTGAGDVLTDDQRHTDGEDGVISGASWVTVSSTDLSLPVTLTAFTAEADRGYVSLKWRTGSELENLGFVLERGSGEQGPFREIASHLTHDVLVGQGSTTQSHVYTFSDMDVETGQTYRYRISDVSYEGKVVPRSTVEVTVRNVKDEVVPLSFRVDPAYPNPFNPTVTIPFHLEKAMRVRLTVYDLNGRIVAELLNREFPAGMQHFEWQPRDMAAGVYFIEIQAGVFRELQKLTLLK